MAAPITSSLISSRAALVQRAPQLLALVRQDEARDLAVDALVEWAADPTTGDPEDLVDLLDRAGLAATRVLVDAVRGAGGMAAWSWSPRPLEAGVDRGEPPRTMARCELGERRPALP